MCEAGCSLGLITVPTFQTSMGFSKTARLFFTATLISSLLWGDRGPRPGEKTAVASKTEHRVQWSKEGGERTEGVFWTVQRIGQAPQCFFFFFPVVTPFCPMDVTFLSFSPSLALSPSFLEVLGRGSKLREVGRDFFSHESSELQFTNYSVN